MGDIAEIVREGKRRRIQVGGVWLWEVPEGTTIIGPIPEEGWKFLMLWAGDFRQMSASEALNYIEQRFKLELGKTYVIAIGMGETFSGFVYKK